MLSGLGGMVAQGERLCSLLFITGLLCLLNLLSACLTPAGRQLHSPRA